jgi:hypothetical protein
VDSHLARLENRLTRLAGDAGSRLLIHSALAECASRFELAAKVGREPGLADILDELVGRLLDSYKDLRLLEGQRILDIACGSSTSRSPATFHLRSARGRTPIESKTDGGYAAVFEPWFCRLAAAMGAHPVGVDRGDLTGESFEHYHVDLGAPEALDFLPSHSFDAVQDSRLFGSPEFRAQFPDKSDRMRVARALVDQEDRLLKAGGRVIHSDAREWVG